MTNYHNLTVFESPFAKTRIGKENDGGYIVANIPDIKYSVLLSGGISNDISFENNFIETYKTECFAFDGSVGSITSKNINFKSQYISMKETNNTTNLHSYIDKYEKIFIKMDIEGAEIEWISSLNENHFNKIEQMVIEFHRPFSDEAQKNLNRLSEFFKLIHLHPNNCCGSSIRGNVSIPEVFECTYLHNRYFDMSNLKLNKEELPSALDMKNVLNNPEISINHPPFVNK